MIRVLALFILGSGLLWTAFVSVGQLGPIAWETYLPALGISVLGTILFRLTSETRHVGVLIVNMQVIRSSLTFLIAKLRNLDPKKQDIRVFVEQHLRPDIHRFLVVRESLISRHGLSTYARIMGSFSQGERALNRACSASADGYHEEVDQCLKRAQALLEQALRWVEEAEAAPPKRRSASGLRPRRRSEPKANEDGQARSPRR